jgi:O-antigen/teichoic acid export membrane protein
MNIRLLSRYALGPIGSALLSFITLPIITWIFSPADIARLNIFHTALSMVLMVSVLGFDQAYVREYHEVSDKDSLFVACFFPGFIFLIIIIISSLLISSRISEILYKETTVVLYLITSLAFIFGFINRFFSLILRMEEMALAFSVSQLLPKLIQLILVIVMALLAFKKEFIYLISIVLISLLSGMFFYIWSINHKLKLVLRTKINFKTTKRLFKFSFPLIFSGFAYWGLTAISTIALSKWSTLDELAIYSVSNSFAGPAVILQSIFLIFWAPMVFKNIAQDIDMKFIGGVRQNVLVAVCLVICFSGTFSWLADFLLPNHYSAVKYILLCQLVQPLFYTLSEVYSIGISIQRKTIYSLLSTLIALVINFFVCLILVPNYGASGAAIANSLAFTFYFLLQTEIAARIWHDFPRLKAYLHVLFLVSLSIITVMEGHHYPFLTHLLWAGFLFLYCYIFLEDLINLYKNIVLYKKNNLITG